MLTYIRVDEEHGSGPDDSDPAAPVPRDVYLRKIDVKAYLQLFTGEFPTAQIP